MKRVATSLIVGVVLVASVVGTAFAHTYVADTWVTINKDPRGVTNVGAKVFIYGKLHSPRPMCRSWEWVHLMRVVPGSPPDRSIDRDRTNSDGNYRFVRSPQNDLTVYVKFFGSFRTRDGHSHRCLSSRSPSQEINVN
jgi:hypothetical protein